MPQAAGQKAPNPLKKNQLLLNNQGLEAQGQNAMVTNSAKSPKFVQINLKMFNNYVASGNNNPPVSNIAGGASL